MLVPHRNRGLIRGLGLLFGLSIGCRSGTGITPPGPAEIEITPQGSLEVNGQPFFPTVVWQQPAYLVEFHKALGMNTIVIGQGEDPDTFLKTCASQDVHAILEVDQYTPERAAHPALLAWILSDEPDLWNRAETPQGLQQRYTEVRTKDPAHPIWINFSPCFMSQYACGKTGLYADFARAADILSFDHYPVTSWNRPDHIPEIGQGTALLRDRYARPGQPVWVIVEASDQDLSSAPAGARGPSAEELRAEVWSAVVNGASGVGYFTIAFNPFRWNNLTAEIEAALRHINRELEDFAPVLLSSPPEHEITLSSPLYGYARSDYVFAVNPTAHEQDGTLTLGGSGGSAIVVGEDRRLPIIQGRLQDHFAPYRVHIYHLIK